MALFFGLHGQARGDNSPRSDHITAHSFRRRLAFSLCDPTFHNHSFSGVAAVLPVVLFWLEQPFYPLFFKTKENKKPTLYFYKVSAFYKWRRGRDSNPRALARKLISSQPRYDHFDTSPYSVLYRYTTAPLLYHTAACLSNGFSPYGIFAM